MQRTVKFGGGGIMVWACFSGNGVGKMALIKNTVNNKVYKTVLRRALVPSIQKLHPDGVYVFQQDNASCHVAKPVKEWFERHSIQYIDNWPAQSPDLNPIENLWDYIDRKIRDKQYSDKKQLWNAVKNAWREIPLETLRLYVDSMPRRLEAVLKNRSTVTRY